MVINVPKLPARFSDLESKPSACLTLLWHVSASAQQLLGDSSPHHILTLYLIKESNTNISFIILTLKAIFKIPMLICKL